MAAKRSNADSGARPSICSSVAGLVSRRFLMSQLRARKQKEELILRSLVDPSILLGVNSGLRRKEEELQALLTSRRTTTLLAASLVDATTNLLNVTARQSDARRRHLMPMSAQSSMITHQAAMPTGDTTRTTKKRRLGLCAETSSNQVTIEPTPNPCVSSSVKSSRQRQSTPIPADHGVPNNKKTKQSQNSDDGQDMKETVCCTPSTVVVPSIDSKRAKTDQRFPEKVLQLLTDAEENGQEHIVSFLPDGKAFRIHKPTEFEANIMPKYFSSHRMSSFCRQLNLYGFRRITTGPQAGGFIHRLFRKDQPELVRKVQRKRQRTPGCDLVHSHDHKVAAVRALTVVNRNRHLLDAHELAPAPLRGSLSVLAGMQGMY